VRGVGLWHAVITIRSVRASAKGERGQGGALFWGGRATSKDEIRLVIDSFGASYQDVEDAGRNLLLRCDAEMLAAEKNVLCFLGLHSGTDGNFGKGERSEHGPS